MKLKNKKTGEIVVFGEGIVDLQKIGCKNVAEMIEAGWCDYEEPKKHYEILAMGAVIELEDDEDEIFRNQAQKEIGNYFSSREEAERAVEKLKAWERLQKKFNFHITGWDVVDTQVIITTDCDLDYVKDRQDDGLWSDLDLVFNGNLLFGGKE